MILVDIDSVGAARPGRPLFADLSLTVSSGDRVGVVGLNGCGKSTLLRVVAGVDGPETGEVRRGRGVTSAFLGQSADLPAGSARAAVGDSWEADAVLDRLGMAERADAETATLSGGEARRVDLARALVTEADLLVLDEPTNHLDIAAVDWLEARLAKHRGGLVLVSHDRHLLDRVTTRILEIDRGSVYFHDGGYGSYLERRAHREEAEATAEAVRRNLARRELAWLRRGARARTRKPKAHRNRADQVISARPQQPARPGELDLHMGTPRLGTKVLELAGVGHGFDGRRLFSGLDLELGRGDRLGVVGPNGAGKSTLLDVVAGRLTPDEGGVATGPTVVMGYYDQTGRDLSGIGRVVDAVTGGDRDPTWRDTALMGRFWFDEDTQWSPVELLSGGERRRLQLVMLLASQPNVLLLDEPTNDLDLDTLRTLEDYLEHWPGTLVVASHDRAFLERTVDEVLVIDGLGSAHRIPGGVEAWERQFRAGFGATKVSRPVGPKRSRAGSGRSVPSIRNDLAHAERQLARMERERDRLVGELDAAGDNHEALARAGTELQAATESLIEAEERWLALSDELEQRQSRS